VAHDRPHLALTIPDDAVVAIKDVEFIHTEVWVSMGEPKEVWKVRIELPSCCFPTR
jgi:ornithine carbamoyltransferase